MLQAWYYGIMSSWTFGSVAYTTIPVVVGELFSSGRSTGFKFYKKFDDPESQLKIDLRLGAFCSYALKFF
jgi:hypothetical protein